MTATQAPRKRWRRLSGEDGFIIVEVLVSAVILITVSLAVFLTFDNADKAAGTQQKRSLAANFAQSELERIRSLPVEDIADERVTNKTVTQGPNTFTETLEAKWVTDGSDEPECTTRSGGLDYLRITTTIGWKNQGTAKPVKMTSFYTPSAGSGGGDTGSASIHITNRNGDPVSGIAVTLDGDQDFTDTTNANGCVVFGFVPQGNYTVRFSRAGYVDGDSNATVADPQIVTAGETQKLQYDYDAGGFTQVTFRTRARNTELITRPSRLQFFNAAQPSGPKTIPLDGSVGTWDNTNAKWDGSNVPLFPYTSPYAVYGGNCSANAVPSNVSDSKFVNISPSAVQNTGTVYLPALDVTVMSGTPAAPGSPVPNAEVRFDPGCTPAYIRMTGSDGKLTDPGFPYTQSGVVCAASGTTGLSPNRRVARSQANVNFGVNGTQITLYLNDSAANGGKSGGYGSAANGTLTSYDCTA